jgi:hypothetical protein
MARGGLVPVQGDDSDRWRRLKVEFRIAPEVSCVEARFTRVSEHVVELSMSQEAGPFTVINHEMAIAWSWPAALQAAEVRLFGPWRTLDGWPVDWPAWPFVPEDRQPREPRAGDRAILAVRQTANLPGLVPFIEYGWVPGYGVHPAMRDFNLPGVLPVDLEHARQLTPLLEDVLTHQRRRPGQKPRLIQHLDAEQTRRRLEEVQRLADVDRLTNEQIAERFGKDPSTIARWLVWAAKSPPRP